MKEVSLSDYLPERSKERREERGKGASSVHSNGINFVCKPYCFNTSFTAREKGKT